MGSQRGRRPALLRTRRNGRDAADCMAPTTRPVHGAVQHQYRRFPASWPALSRNGGAFPRDRPTDRCTQPGAKCGTAHGRRLWYRGARRALGQRSVDGGNGESSENQGCAALSPIVQARGVLWRNSRDLVPRSYRVPGGLQQLVGGACRCCRSYGIDAVMTATRRHRLLSTNDPVCAASCRVLLRDLWFARSRS